MTTPEPAPCRWELDIPLWQGKPPLTANEVRRMHWRAERNRIQLVRDRVQWAAREAALGPIGTTLERAVVRVHYQPSTNRRRDASNLMPTQKAAVDGLVRAGVVPDDCEPYVTELMPVIHPAVPGVAPRLWLEVRCG